VRAGYYPFQELADRAGFRRPGVALTATKRMVRGVLQNNKLMKLNPVDRCQRVKEALRTALNKLLDRDLDLLAMGAHEQAICHRLAGYLDAMTDLNVDCEYNRDMLQPKRLKDGKPFRPDIIIHRRLSNESNLLVVEAKAGPQDEKKDIEKLQELIDEAGQYHYFVGAFIRFFNDPVRVRDTREVVIRLRWFVTSRGITEEETFIRRVGDELNNRVRTAL
jgi:hypothetical protein